MSLHSEKNYPAILEEIRKNQKRIDEANQEIKSTLIRLTIDEEIKQSLINMFDMIDQLSCDESFTAERKILLLNKMMETPMMEDDEKHSQLAAIKDNLENQLIPALRINELFAKSNETLKQSSGKENGIDKFKEAVAERSNKEMYTRFARTLHGDGMASNTELTKTNEAPNKLSPTHVKEKNNASLRDEIIETPAKFKFHEDARGRKILELSPDEIKRMKESWSKAASNLKGVSPKIIDIHSTIGKLNNKEATLLEKMQEQQERRSFRM